MRESIQQFLSNRREHSSYSRQLHKELVLPGRYAEPASLRNLYFDCGRALLDALPARAGEAIITFNQALQEDKDSSTIPDWEVYVYLAAAYEKNEDIQAAFHAYLEAALQEPQHANLLLERAHGLITRKRGIVRAESEWLLHEWIAIRTSPGLDQKQLNSINQFIGRVHLHLRMYDAAVDDFEQAQREMPGDVRVLEGLGQALWRSGKTERAVNILRKAYELARQVEQSDRLIPTNAKLVQALAAAGQYKNALSYMPADIMTNMPFAYEFLMVGGLCHLALGEPQEALIAAKSAAESRPTDCEPYLLCAQAYIALGEHEQAVSATNEALQRNPSNGDILFYQAQALIEGNIDLAQGLRLLETYREDGKEETLIERIQSASFSVRENDARMHYFRAQLYFTFSHDSEITYYQQAEQEIKRAFELQFLIAASKLEAPAQQLRGDILVASVRNKGLDLSQPEAEQAASHYYEAGILFYNQQLYTEAEAGLKKAIELRPEHALSYLYCCAALAFSATEDSPLSSEEEKVREEKLKQACQLWENGEVLGFSTSFLSWAYFIYAFCLWQQAFTVERRTGETELFWKSAFYVERAVLLQPDEDTYLSLLSLCYMSLSRSTSALVTMPLVPGSAELLYLKALMLIFLEDEHAGEAFQSIDDHNKTIDLRLAYAWLLYLKKDFSGAIEQLDQCIAIDENHFNAWILRGRIYRLLGDDVQAQANFQQIWKKTTPGLPLDIPGNLMKRAYAGYELGYYTDAIDILQVAIEKASASYFDIYSALMFCYLNLENIDDAKKACLDALKQIPALTLQLHSNLQDLNEFEQFHLRENAKTLYTREVLALYRDELEKKLRQVREQAERDSGAVLELVQPIEENQFEAGSIEWVSSLAGAARLSLRTQQFDKAIEYYSMLVEAYDSNEQLLMPEARIGLARAFKEVGIEKAFEGQIEDAVEALYHSLQLYNDAKQDNMGQKIIQDVYARITTREHYLAISEIIHLLANESAVDTQRRHGLSIAQLELSKNSYLATMHPSRKEKDFEQLTPQFIAAGCLTIELGLGLIDERLLNEQVIKIDIPEMRKRVHQNMGVHVPGIQLRDNLSLPYYCYQILFYNTPFVTETIDVNNSSDGMLEAYHVILSQMEELLLANLDILLGTQEVQFTLDEWKKEGGEEYRTLMSEALPDELSVARLAQVLRRLVRERISVADLGTILKAFKDKKGLEVDEIARYIRGILGQEVLDKQVSAS